MLYGQSRKLKLPPFLHVLYFWYHFCSLLLPCQSALPSFLAPSFAGTAEGETTQKCLKAFLHPSYAELAGKYFQNLTDCWIITDRYFPAGMYIHWALHCSVPGTLLYCLVTLLPSPAGPPEEPCVPVARGGTRNRLYTALLPPHLGSHPRLLQNSCAEEHLIPCRALLQCGGIW